MRVTAGREATLAFLAAHPHSSAADIHRGLSAQLPSLTPQSVHNIVQDLAGAGILQRISPPASNAALYEIADEHAHHHVQCVRCGRVVDVPASEPTGHVQSADSAHGTGMTIIGVEVTYLGVCASCSTP
ncbi:Fur family transcriptional regulator [Leucobacter chromiireducens]|uniref:Fur family transcriptional regulator n=1 Tax=Leucobacter chromiireducens TaxID=283877 RepID=UPI001F01DC10|nr:transcriptional repressor [Leucobacter chromiireducens]